MTIPLLAFLIVTAIRIAMAKPKEARILGENTLVLSSGKEAIVEIGEDCASVKNCYLYGREDRLSICFYIDRRWKEMGLNHERSVESLEAELSLHSYCYLLGIERERSKDAELDRVEDPRAYVRVGYKTLEALGI